MAGRVLERKKRRLACELRIGDQLHSGMVLDLSAGGVFVQTSARVGPGQQAELDVSLPGISEPARLRIEVVHQKRVPAQLRALAKGGIGARITAAPEAYYQFVRSLDADGASPPASAGSASAARSSDPSSAARPAKPPPPSVAKRAQPAPKARSAARPAPPRPAARKTPQTTSYRVYVKQKSGPRSRRLIVQAETQHAAAQLALEELGEGWEVREVSALAP